MKLTVKTIKEGKFKTIINGQYPIVSMWFLKWFSFWGVACIFCELWQISAVWSPTSCIQTSFLCNRFTALKTSWRQMTSFRYKSVELFDVPNLFSKLNFDFSRSSFFVWCTLSWDHDLASSRPFLHHKRYVALCTVFN